MSELIEWLRAQIDEDERVARAIPVPEWAEDASWLTDMLDPLPSQRHERPAGWQPMITPEDVRHIARQDPDRTLAEVKAKRAILELHQPWTAVSAHVIPNPRCRECGDVDDAPVAWPCSTVRLVALGYAGQPGYQKEWAL